VAPSLQNDGCPLPVSNVGGVDAAVQHEALGIDEEVPFASASFLGAVIAPWPPFSVVLMD
jgi:hypothetical protein